MREFNTKEAEGNYSITFETDDRKAFEQVQTLCRILIDGKNGEAIPIEWIREWAMENWYRTNNSYWYIVAIRMIEEWMEKENETN